MELEVAEMQVQTKCAVEDPRKKIQGDMDDREDLIARIDDLEVTTKTPSAEIDTS